MRYFLIDRVTDYKAGELAVGVKNITLSDDILQDHFPEYPVMPGVLIVEAMAQLAGFLIETSVNTPETIRRAVLAQVDQAKFHRLAEPGDQIRISVAIDQQFDDAVRVVGEATIEGDKASQAKLMFVLEGIEVDAVHTQRKQLYKQWTKKLDNPPAIL